MKFILYLIAITLVVSTTSCTSVKTIRKRIDHITDSLVTHKVEISKDSNSIINSSDILVFSKDGSEYIDTSEKVTIIFEDFDTASNKIIIDTISSGTIGIIFDASANTAIHGSRLVFSKKLSDISIKPKAIIIEKKRISLKKNIVVDSHTIYNITQSLVKLRSNTQDSSHVNREEIINTKDKEKTGISLIKILIIAGASIIGIVIIIYVVYRIKRNKIIEPINNVNSGTI